MRTVRADIRRLAPRVLRNDETRGPKSSRAALRTIFPSHRAAYILLRSMTDARHPLAIRHPELTDDAIRRLVTTFYGRARQDELIGPIFNAAVADWDDHLGKITDFWSSMLLKTDRYHGRPMRPHFMLGLKGDHFDRWLALFEATARQLFAPELAAVFIVRARRIADSFEMNIATARGEIAAPRHSV